MGKTGQMVPEDIRMNELAKGSPHLCDHQLRQKEKHTRVFLQKVKLLSLSRLSLFCILSMPAPHIYVTKGQQE